jgi:hypothetical protein
MNAALEEMRKDIVDFRPVTKEEWDEINGDTD